MSYIITGHGAEFEHALHDSFLVDEGFAFAVKAKCGQLIYTKRVYQKAHILRNHRTLPNISGPLTLEKKRKIGELLGRTEFYTHDGTRYPNHVVTLLSYVSWDDPVNKYLIDIDYNGIIPLENMMLSSRVLERKRDENITYAVEIPAPTFTKEYVHTIIYHIYRLAVYPSRQDIDAFLAQSTVPFTDSTQYYKDLIMELRSSPMINVTLERIMNIMKQRGRNGGVFYHSLCRIVHLPSFEKIPVIRKRLGENIPRWVIPRNIQRQMRNPARYPELYEILERYMKIWEHEDVYGYNSNNSVMTNEISNNEYDSNQNQNSNSNSDPPAKIRKLTKKGGKHRKNHKRRILRKTHKKRK